MLSIYTKLYLKIGVIVFEEINAFYFLNSGAVRFVSGGLVVSLATEGALVWGMTIYALLYPIKN